ncbi:N-acetylmuramoyl-L-alanine amidase [Salinicoccus luteus]|uniref:N-acetylmuramoyl-L-alanine amidase n=1 Tax=Salinicoccus luteus TaxID=367840 RepID=UPI00068E4122|nr:N-acetylmuramoyl-L-alanine amidase [Salinicoccus luteus]
MTLKIGVSRGHGKYTAGKRSPAGEREWYFNDPVADAFMEMMGNYDDVEIIEVSDPIGEVDTPLTTRTDFANQNKVDVYIAFHHNAYQGVWFNGGGSEVHVRPYAPQSYELASIVAPLVSKAMGITNRGVKVTNLHETREPHQLAILVEGGFMDSNQDIVAMRDKNKLKAQGEAVARGVAEYFGLNMISAPAPKATPYTIGEWKTNAYGTQWIEARGTFTVGGTRIMSRFGSPFLSAPEGGYANPGWSTEYVELMRQDGHVWIGYYVNGRYKTLPVKTWNPTTGIVGADWGTFS